MQLEKEISMQIIDININNIDNEHICCSISEKKGENCVFSKKAWMKNNFDKGLVFKRFDVRGKAFIEYIPAENAWCPITADNYIFINCFWISGKFKGQGYSNLLLQECVDDAKSKGKYAPILKKIANSRGIDVNLIKFETAKEAQNAPAPFTTYSLFFNGEFVTNEILSEKKIEKFLDTNIKKFN